MITYFWYVEDGWGNKIDGISEVDKPIDHTNYESIKNKVYDFISSQYSQFDHRTMSIKSLSKL